ncbi:unnamed protein product [Cuscuta europaea]|uniref:rRNA N-glycosylase n=1 Tax=Cuscuta europaea TaxID=41803 RepID=A0A9P0ZXZ4_CUSEU|nr:unnamed protein product [Cuscuta europaea]CAH9116748.1 unnamed protein product [Cuscuta europaea]CAH9116749.1 unnamed protein product [Cuscuta europaea]CAH9116750.1 unnamed protein product [Cuscuta europaea]
MTDGDFFWNTEVLDFSTILDPTAFVNSINELRMSFGTPLGDILVVEPLSEKEKKKLFRLTLRYADTELQVAIRRSDLYVIGFKTGDGWLELQENSPKKQEIKGSTMINLGMDYASLRFASADKRALLGGPEMLGKSLRFLKGVKTSEINLKKLQGLARELLTLIITVSESLRFNHILHFVSDFFGEGCSEAAPDWILGLVNQWGTLSKYVLKYKDSGEKEKVAELEKFPIEVYDWNKKKKVKLTKVKHIKSAMGLIKRPRFEIGESSKGNH